MPSGLLGELGERLPLVGCRHWCPSWVARRTLSDLPREAAAASLAVREDRSMIEVEVLAADVTKLDVDAITNAANTSLKHGGGVAAAIAHAGGQSVQRESKEKAPIGLGEAVETTAGDMPSRYVIHAATMVDPGGSSSAEGIGRATRAALA